MTTAEDIERARAEENRLATVEGDVKMLLTVQAEMRTEKRENDRLVLEKLQDFDRLRTQLHFLAALLLPLYAGVIGLMLRGGH